MRKLSKKELKNVNGGVCEIVIDPATNCDEYCDIQRRYAGVDICYNNSQIPLPCEASYM